MDSKSLATLELPKILDRLASYCAFSGGAALARELTPTTDIDVARRLQQETTEARKLLSVKTDVTLGGARDVRQFAADAAIGAVLMPGEILDLKNTLIAGRALKRTLSRLGDQFPRLAAIARGIDECPGIVEAIGRTIDERGEVLSSASDKLASIRHRLRVAHDRLLQKLQTILNSSRYATYLQENIITQREGRYVVPLKAEHKGKLRGIVHDQSSSGATIFVEPLATVELNNEWRKLQLEEQEEIRRILAELCKLIGEQAHAIQYTVDALAELDLAFAKAKYADAIRASEPVLHQISNLKSQISNARQHPGSAIRLREARHPLLDPATVVPVDFVLDDQTYVVVVTGPNTGGKTVSLKTVGLLALMAQCGLNIPVQSGSELSVFDAIYADIGDEQSIEQSLSTFSSHVTNIIGILKKAGSRSLVILDELGAGTDPAEGSALARAILSFLLDTGSTTLATTHYPELKVYAHTTPGVANASVEFDLETLAPTFHLTIGLPGRSNAFAIARRLGLEQTVIAEAQKMVPASDLEAEKLLDEIHRQRDLARRERTLAEAVRADVLALETELTRRLERIEDERQKIIEEAREEARKEVGTLQEEAKALRKKMQAASLPLSAVKEIEAAAESLADEADKPITPSSIEFVAERSVVKKPLRLGDRVWLTHLKTEGAVLSLTTTDAEVQVGRLRIRAKLDELQTLAEKSQSLNSKIPITTSTRPRTPTTTQPRPATGMEIDLRGQTVEDGLMMLERYLDSAYMAQMPWVRIIHGKGTGRLRQAVRDALRASDLVASHETGSDTEGGDGVTIARLAISDV
ncbi:MAG TPA: endonuclease MutS2 [Anaerolineales bacterium]|nr:endonuclease MutS2 [Anaerolineales bacterium]